jgi:hypothetical protein
MAHGQTLPKTAKKSGLFHLNFNFINANNINPLVVSCPFGNRPLKPGIEPL